MRQYFSGPETVVPGALRGYRMFDWRNDRLDSCNGRQGGWDGYGRATAKCLAFTASSRHEAPLASCSCGIYGWYRPTETRLHHGDVFANGRDPVLRGPRGVQVFSTRDALIDAYPPDDVRELLGHEIPEAEPTSFGMVYIQIGASAAAAAKAIEEMAKAAQWLSTSIGAPVQFGKQDAQQLVRKLKAEIRGYRAPLMIVDEAASFAPMTPRERALKARQTRNTGPAPKRRAGIDVPSR